MIFYDFEVFKYDWLVVLIDPENRQIKKIHNDFDELNEFYQDNVNEIWVGFNSRHYDRWILKGILVGFDPYDINEFIITKNQPGWRFSRLLNKIPLLNYDVMTRVDRGLKVFEGFMGNDIVESSVSFDTDRKLTPEEIEEVFKYCTHDVEQTIEVFIERFKSFEAHVNLVKNFELPISDINKTGSQLAAVILDASKQSYDDEFEISFPKTLRLNQYWHVLEWYKNPTNLNYKQSYVTRVAGMEMTFAWGGLHGAIPKYQGEGYFINMDVASLYPNLMINYNLHSRSIKDPQKFTDIVKTRLKYKAEKNPLEAPLKLVINSTYGSMKDKYNPLYDPRQANNVCVYGQLLLLDLIEKLEPHCEIIQANTDGVLIKLDNADDYDLIDDICYEWESRTGLILEFKEYAKVFQKDVNNYVVVGHDGKYKSKGAWVKELDRLDYEMAAVNRSIINYMINGQLPEITIGQSTSLIDFQQVKKISRLYDHLSHNGKILKEKTVRVFASKRKSDGGLFMKHVNKTTLDKVANTPGNCFLVNDNINDVSIPRKLDLQWYIDLAYQRLRDFGINV